MTSSLSPKNQYLSAFYGDRDPGRFPLKVSPETTNHCNLRCPYCPREDSGRGVGHMNSRLFDSIVEQMAGKLSVLAPQGFGEPLIHPEIGAMLRRATERGVRYIDLVTNGTLLDEERCRAIFDAKVTLVTIELDGADPEVFERGRVNARYDEVVANVQRLFRMRDELGAELPHICLQVIRLPDVIPSLPAFYELWQPFLRDQDEICEGTPVTWAGDRPMPGMRAATDAELASRPPCRLLYKQLQVFYDGRATPCIYDHSCQLEVGNASDQSIAEIWGGEPLRRLRELHEQGRSGEIPLCKGCPDHMP